MSEEQFCQGNAKKSRTGGGLGSRRVGLGSIIERLGRVRRVERLGRKAIGRSCLGFYPRCICWVGDGNRLGVLVLSVMFLGVDLFVFLKILRTFKRLVADLANMRLERRMDY